MVIVEGRQRKVIRRFEGGHEVWSASRAEIRHERRDGPEMAATAVLSVRLIEDSVKVRTGMPADGPEDYDLDVWAGVLPISVTFGSPEPDPKMREEMLSPAAAERDPGGGTAQSGFAHRAEATASWSDYKYYDDYDYEEWGP